MCTNLYTWFQSYSPPWKIQFKGIYPLAIEYGNRQSIILDDLFPLKPPCMVDFPRLMTPEPSTKIHWGLPQTPGRFGRRAGRAAKQCGVLGLKTCFFQRACHWHRPIVHVWLGFRLKILKPHDEFFGKHDSVEHGLTNDPFASVPMQNCDFP